jgi:MarR family transcriptional regulator, lower aerobic nicotinate degradation pathway regulator
MATKNQASNNPYIEPRSARHSGAAELMALLSMPGYLIRRSKQRTTGIFSELCPESGVTPIQFTTLFILNACPMIDQTELGEYAALDSSTMGDVIQRLASRGLLKRSKLGNRSICSVTTRGASLVERMTPSVVEAQKRMLSALTSREQEQFLRLLSKLNGVTNNYYAPRKRSNRAKPENSKESSRQSRPLRQGSASYRLEASPPRRDEGPDRL